MDIKNNNNSNSSNYVQVEGHPNNPFTTFTTNTSNTSEMIYVDGSRKKRAFITGIGGQDGSYLAEYLLSLNYEVYGMIRRHSVSSSQESRIGHLNDKIITFYGDLLDKSSIDHILQTIQPDEIYNLAAMSHVKVSFDVPEFTLQTNLIGVLNMLESYRKNCPNAKFYQATSSECFGLSVEDNGSQNELTTMNPTSPYGVSKVGAYNLVRHYRRAYNLHAVNGILFNHSGPRRGETFVEQKIVKTAVQIKKGLTNELVLGNLDSYRDIGASKDYVRAMHAISNYEFPEDFVIATGQTCSVRQICEYVFEKLGMDYKDHVRQDEKYMRPEELPYLCGDPGKAKMLLNWKPEYTIYTLLDEMIDYWMKII